MLLGGESVLIAVSGGVDSMTLLDIMARMAPVMKLQLGVAYFDHELRGEASQEDANFVSEQARIRGLKVYIGHGDVKRLAAERKLSIEDAARRSRYYFLERIARRHNYSVVMTGHSADDNAETVLLNLLRGSGVTGLAGMPPVRPLGKGITVARPLLWAGREEIQAYAEEVGLQWREDETNRSARFTRNRIRHELIPVLKEYNPGIIGTLNSTADIMRGVEQFLGHSVRIAAKRVVASRSSEVVELNLSQLKHYLPTIQAELVQRIVSKNFESAPISYSAIERVLGLLWKESGSRAELVGGISAVRDRDTLIIRRDPPPFVPIEKTFDQGEVVELGRQRLVTKLLPNEGIQFSNKRHIEYLDADRLPKHLVVRSWREGDRFRPLGMEGEKKLSDFLIDVKVPVDKKRDVLVVADGDTIAWVCGYRIDERFKVGPETTNVLKLEMLSGGDGRHSGGDSRKQGTASSDRNRGGKKKQGKEQSGQGRQEQSGQDRAERKQPEQGNQGQPGNAKGQSGRRENEQRGRSEQRQGAGQSGKGQSGRKEGEQRGRSEQRQGQSGEKGAGGAEGARAGQSRSDQSSQSEATEARSEQNRPKRQEPEGARSASNEAGSGEGPGAQEQGNARHTDQEAQEKGSGGRSGRGRRGGRRGGRKRPPSNGENDG